MRLLCCIVFSCLLFLAGAKHLGRQEYNKDYAFLQNAHGYPQQEQIGGQYGNSYQYYNKFNVPQLQERQKFLLDVLLQVQKPVVNTEIIQLGDRLITESSFYTQPNNKFLLDFLEQCQQGKVNSHQFVGLYNFFVLPRDYETFQRNVAYARIHMDPYKFVTALQLAVRDREDCRDLVFPAFYEILPEYFYERNIIDSAKTIDYSVLSNGVSSMKPTIFNLIGVSRLLGGFPLNLIKKPLINQKYSQLDSKIILGGQDDQQISYLTEDVGLNTFWNNVIAERQLQCITGRRQQALGGNQYQRNYYSGKQRNQYNVDSYQQYTPFFNQYKQNARDEMRQQDSSRFVRVGLDKQYNQGIGGYTKYGYENILGNRNQELPETSIENERLLHINRRRYEQKFGDQQQNYGQQYGNKQQYYQQKYGQQYGAQQQKYGQQYFPQLNYDQQYPKEYEQEEYNMGNEKYNTDYRKHLFGKNIIGEGHKVEQYKSRDEDYHQNLYKEKQQQRQQYEDKYRKYYGNQNFQQGEQGQNFIRRPYGNYYPQEKQEERNNYQYSKYEKEGNYGKVEGKQFRQYYDDQKYYQQQQNQRQTPYGKYIDEQDLYKYPIVEGDRLMQGRYPRSIQGRYQQQESMQSPAQNLMALRSGEIFIQNLRQLIARINLENLALKLEQQQGNNYELELQIRTHGEQFYLNNIQNRQIIDQCIDRAIDQLGSIINDELKRRQINENSEEVFRVLTDVLMNYNEELNGNVWDEIYNNIVRDIYRGYNQEQSSAYDYYLYGAQYLNQPIRNLRDPIYIEIVQKLVQFINTYTRQIQQYTAQDLLYSDVIVKDVNVDSLITYTQQFDHDLINLIDEPLNQDKLERIQSKVVARRERLNHQPFTISYELQAQKPERVVVRTLLGPKYNERQQLVSLEEDRDKFIVLDAYMKNLNIGENYIQRSSQQMARYAGSTVTTLSEIYKRVLYGKSFDDLVSDEGRFPHRLLLPRGTTQGLPMQLLVVVTPLDYQFYQENIDYKQIYGCGIPTLNLDNLALNYPLDRDMQISEQQFVQYPNVYLKDVEILHKYEY